MIAALYVETDGCYFGLPDVDPWDQARDARLYAGPHPVVAHPPCQRWGRFWHGSTRRPHQFKMGDDDGCFAAAIDSVLMHGGVLEHPADSHAWYWFGLEKPKRGGGWHHFRLQQTGYAVTHAWTCYVEQGQYGHFARKGTWLLYSGGTKPFELDWTIGEQRIDPRALAKHGYEKARRIGMVAMVGGKDKTKIRNATPPDFRDVLIRLAIYSGSPNAQANRPPSGGPVE